MKMTRFVLTALFVMIVAGRAQAQPFVLYDDFSSPLIDSGKWTSFQAGIRVMDAGRFIQGGQLQFAMVG